MSAYAKNALDLYSYFKEGHLLFSGGVYDQPATYLAAMQTVQDTIASLEPDEDG